MSSRIVGKNTGKDEKETLHEKYIKAVNQGFGSLKVFNVSRILMPEKRRATC